MGRVWLPYNFFHTKQLKSRLVIEYTINLLSFEIDIMILCIIYGSFTTRWFKYNCNMSKYFAIIFQAKKIEEHERNKERRKEEKELKEKKDRIQKAREAREKAAKEAAENAKAGGMPGGMGDGMGGLGMIKISLHYNILICLIFSKNQIALFLKQMQIQPSLIQVVCSKIQNY